MSKMASVLHDHWLGPGGRAMRSQQPGTGPFCTQLYDLQADMAIEITSVNVCTCMYAGKSTYR